MGAHTHAHPWVLGGHGCDNIVHAWEWVGMGAILLFMGGYGCDIISNIIGNVIVFYMGAI